MEFGHFTVKTERRNAVVTVELRGVESDVFLLDWSNFKIFERGGDPRGQGGHYDRSPVRFVVPQPGEWHVVVIPIGGTIDGTGSVE